LAASGCKGHRDKICPQKDRLQSVGLLRA
jgi:hypothetical protein